MTAKQIMIELIVHLSALSPDSAAVDPIAMIGDEQYINQMYCLSINSYFETRGEKFNDKVSMAQAVMARVEDDKGEFRNYNSPCEVVHKANYNISGNVIRNQCWYSWFCDGKSDKPRIYRKDGSINQQEMDAWNDSVMAAYYAHEDLYPDLIDGATHYYNDQLASPGWANNYDVVARVGKHVFLK